MSEYLHDPEHPGYLDRARALVRRVFTHGGNDDQLPPDHDEMEEYYRNLRRQHMDARPAGPGLKEYDLDYGLFRDSGQLAPITSSPTRFFYTFAGVLERYNQDHPQVQGFHDDTASNPFVALMHSGAMLSSPTRELDEWLTEHLPQNGYFTPEMVAVAVEDNPDVAVDVRQENGLHVWQFSDATTSFSLSRAVDSSRPTVSTTPYLAVHYPTEYDFDTHELVSTPRLTLGGGGPEERRILREGVGVPIARALGLQPIRLRQPIDFRIVEAAPRPYLTAPDPRSLESVVAQRHVIADFPPAAQ